jgi:glycosyltransferase involved in cell wall biosynthesis
MKIGYVTGSLGRGGAEMQLLQLTRGLIERGHAVSVIAYGGPGVLDSGFRAAGAHLTVHKALRRYEKVTVVRSWMQEHAFDVVHGLLPQPSCVSLIARYPRRMPPVIATEFSSSTYESHSLRTRAALICFHLADSVVTEVNLNAQSMKALGPWLRHKITVIPNGVDLERFTPSTGSTPSEPFVFCAVGTLSRGKNVLNVIEAVALLRVRASRAFRLNWYGRDSLDSALSVGDTARRMVVERGLEDVVSFQGDTQKIEDAYRRSHALVHSSTAEGFPNAVAEAMAAGLPIAVSRVSDLPSVVHEAKNGVVFDETNPSAIADAMGRLMMLDLDARTKMAERSRRFAESRFGLNRFILDYEQLYLQLRSTSA